MIRTKIFGIKFDVLEIELQEKKTRTLKSKILRSKTFLKIFMKIFDSKKSSSESNRLAEFVLKSNNRMSRV